jgi:hypothetical protein
LLSSWKKPPFKLADEIVKLQFCNFVSKKKHLAACGPKVRKASGKTSDFWLDAFGFAVGLLVFALLGICFAWLLLLFAFERLVYYNLA